MNWTLEDIPWSSFESGKINRKLLAVIKTASLVERNSADYAIYLCNVFAEDDAFCEAARQWAEEEAQHGEALGRWSEMADPSFDFASRFARFVTGYRIPVTAEKSVRGSRCGELVARCVVESGTSSFYTALRDASDEPVLRRICQRIAADEFRHYKLFYDTLQGYRAAETSWRLGRLMTAIGRLHEVGDDELSFAYHCANEEPDQPYSRARAGEAYARVASSVYRRWHITRAANMMLKASGISPRGWLGWTVAQLVWLHVRRQQRRALAA
ncbi:MAG: ferritin-like domain-containing protein [Rhodospirillales bacterium]|nr:ferritin-like domain-containing protein [Rhodospirillales bacterium]